ncbi:hypothetical protein [Bdellovibrio bacteriovorus]|uniref:hypothetical protein n=1 Tax=Bdellovibrio bacteriovorus TaxID=959 RepID=UPI0035A5B60B
MKNWKKWVIGISAIAVLASLSWAFNEFLADSMESASDSEVIATLKGYAMAEESYFREYQEFALNEEKIGFSAESKHMKVFFTKKALPAKYLDVLEVDSLPYVAKDSYRILLAAERQDKNRIEFWTVSNSHGPRKLKQHVPVE